MLTFWLLFATIVLAVSAIAYTAKFVRFWYLLSAIVFAVSTMVYASTFFGFGLVERLPQLVFLPVFALAALIAALVSLGDDWRRKKRKPKSGWSTMRLGRGGSEGRSSLTPSHVSSCFWSSEEGAPPETRRPIRGRLEGERRGI